jgi:phosphomannomutase/phosphoglucomutase
MEIRELLRPGLGIKRWVLAFFVGVICLGLGMAYLLAEFYRNVSLPGWVYYLTLQFIPQWQRGVLFLVVGLALFVVAVRHLRRDLINPLLQERSIRAGLSEFVHERSARKINLVVVFAGTEGLSMLLRIADQVQWDIVGVVPPVGSGVAFARLRREIGITADDILFPTLQPVEVVAELEDGSRLVGELEIAANDTGLSIRKVYLESRRSEEEVEEMLASPELLEQIRATDAIVIGPGSLFTNLIPTLLVPEVNEAIRKSEARKIFVCNIMTQPHQTAGFTVGDHLRAIQDNCGFRVDYVLVAAGSDISADILERYRDAEAELVGSLTRLDREARVTLFEGTPEELMLVEGAILVERDNLVQEQVLQLRGGKSKTVLRHNSQELALAIAELLEDYAFRARASVGRAVFREYDVRGVAYEELTDRAMYVMGQAFGTYLQRRTGRNRIIVGRDVRLSSLGFQDCFMEGLVDTGCDVIDIGQAPTPLAYFATTHLFADGSAIVTASHNPPEFNGLKIQLGINPIAGTELQYIERLIAKGAYKKGQGSVHKHDIYEPYVNCVLRKITLARPLKVVLDGGSGTAGELGLQLLERLGCEVVPLYCEPDGTFPHHEPDPLEPENVQDLIAAVLREKADFGAAFDGDGDRVGLVDETGRIVLPDQYLALFARQVLEDGPAKIVFEVRCSQALIDDIIAHDGLPIMVKCGNAFILQKMQEEQAPLGGELSGHIFFYDPPINFDDATFGACKMAQFLSESDLPLSELVNQLPAYHSSPEIRIFCPDHKKFDIVESLKYAFIEDTSGNVQEVIDIDGARVVFSNGGWALVRPSNTQPRLSIRVEAKMEEDLAVVKRLLREKLLAALPEAEEEIQKHLSA